MLGVRCNGAFQPAIVWRVSGAREWRAGRAIGRHGMARVSAFCHAVVDMWPRGYLQPPDGMTVEKWVKED